MSFKRTFTTAETHSGELMRVVFRHEGILGIATGLILRSYFGGFLHLENGSVLYIPNYLR